MNIDTTPNQPDEFNIFGHKISKSAVYALILIFIGFCMFLGGLVTIFLGGDQKKAVQKKVPAWQQRNPSVSSRTMTGVTISTFGCFIAIFGSAWYCFAKKNKLTKAPPNVQVVVPSEIDPHGPQTQFTDINFDDSDMASDTERETTPFGAGALDPHKRSILLKQHNARYNQNIIPVNQDEQNRGPSTVSKVAFNDHVQHN